MSKESSERPRQRARTSTAHAIRMTHDTTTTDYPMPPYRTYTQSKGHRVNIRLPARIWNAYTPSAPASPRPTRCTYRPGGGSFRYGTRSITYLQPCLRNTCPNCRKWYPKLLDGELESRSLRVTQEKTEDILHSGRAEDTVPPTIPTEPSMTPVQGSAPETPASCRVHLRFRSVGSRQHYETLMLEQRLRCEVSH